MTQLPATIQDGVLALFTSLPAYAQMELSPEVVTKTPDRVAKAWKEMLRGYDMSPQEVLGTLFETGQDLDEVVLVRNIQFVSVCEHHLFPFYGEMHVGYLPLQGRIVGLSKLARLVESLACRLQIQERLTCDVAMALQTKTRARGVAVVARAVHGCMQCRGVLQRESDTVTSAMFGKFRTDVSARSEIFSMIGVQKT